MSVEADRVQAGPLGAEDLALLSEPLGTLAASRTAPVTVLAATRLRKGVHRLRLAGARQPSVVVKRLSATRAHLERGVTDRWLPAAGQAGLGPLRHATIAEADGRHVWHVYEDLGALGLDRRDVEPTCVDAAMDRLADLHASFAALPMLAEPRFTAGDLGVYFYVNSVRDAARCLEGLHPAVVRMSTEERAVRDAVLEHLSQLLLDEPRRVRLLQEQSGPETLLHGDLTRANVFVLPGSPRHQVRLIDWDHVGVGPAGFDISTHVAHYPPDQRHGVLERYARAMSERGHPFPDDVDWDLLVNTFEAGRLANQVIWIALGIVEGNEWGFRTLASWAEALAAAVTGTHDGAATAKEQW